MKEADWIEADSISNLTQIEPTEGGIPTGRTVVKVLFNAQELVFGIEAHDPNPSAIVAFDTQRDASLRDEDNIRIVLDPFLDNTSDILGTNTRLRWTFLPAGDLFVVYNHNVRNRPQDGFRFQSNELLIKIQHEFRF